MEEAIVREEQDLKKGEWPEFGEEKVDAVNAILCRLRKGMKSAILFYSYGQCRELKGHVRYWHWLDEILDISELPE